MVGIGNQTEETNEQNATQTLDQTQVEINDLGQALQYIRGDHAQMAEGGMAGEEQQEGQNSQTELQKTEEGFTSTGSLGSQSQPMDSGSSMASGGSTTSAPGNDYSAAQKDLLNHARNTAIQNVHKKFKEQKIKAWDISDIYQQDPNSGTVTFINPDDQHHPFASRAEAQSWIDAMNNQINSKFRQEVIQEQQKIMTDLAPTQRLLLFAPKYDAMSDEVREVFDDLVEPYSVKDQNGNYIGFSCDLEQIANLAESMVGKFKSKYEIQKETKENTQPEPTTPALDMQSNSNGSKGSDLSREPSDIEDAMKLLQEMKADKAKKESK